jgi:Protein of unknown function (DUF1254)
LPRRKRPPSKLNSSPSRTTIAPTDVNFAGVVKNDGFGKFRHGRELAPPVQQGILRPNRDTLYSFAIFDLDAGPVTITLPEGAKRFMAMQVVNQDQYTPATYYGAGNHTLTREVTGTRYAIAVARFLVDFSNKEEIQQVHALQDALKVSQESSGAFEVPNWDEASLKKVQAALLQLGTTISDTRMFGANKNEVDPVKHLIGSAMLWGQSREGRTLSPDHARPERGQHHLQADCQGYPRQWLLVPHRLQQRRLLAAEPGQRLFGEQSHGEERSRWFDRHPVWWLRRQDPQLPTDHEGVELHRAPLSPATGNPRRHVEVSLGTARELDALKGSVL